MYASPLASFRFCPLSFPWRLALEHVRHHSLERQGPSDEANSITLATHLARLLTPYGASSSFRFLPTPYDTALFLRWSAALVLSLLVIRACDMAPSPTPQFKGACQSCGAASE